MEAFFAPSSSGSFSNSVKRVSERGEGMQSRWEGGQKQSYYHWWSSQQNY